MSGDIGLELLQWSTLTHNWLVQKVPLAFQRHNSCWGPPMLLGVGPSESQDCKVSAAVVKSGQTLTRVLVIGFKFNQYWLKQALETGTGLVVLPAGAGPLVRPHSAAVLEVVQHNKHTLVTKPFCGPTARDPECTGCL